jgi:GNAT superfamily N-acetyltransferase
MAERPGKRAKTESVSASSSSSGAPSGASAAQADLVQAVLSRLAQQQQQQQQKQTQGGLQTSDAAGYDAQEPGIEDGRDVPEGFPVDFVAERERCVSLLLGCTGGAQDESAEAQAPAFVHQVLARDRYVLGYRALRVDLRYTKRWRALLSVSFTARLDGADAERWGADFLDEDVAGTVLQSAVRPDHGGEQSFTTNAAEFAQWAREDAAACVAHAQLARADSFEGVPCQVLSQREMRGGRTLQLLRCERLHASAQGRALLSKCQAMSLWWVESSEQTDALDARWSLLLAVADGELLGFTSLFCFTNPLREARPHAWRICQALVLPHAQRCGVGRDMVRLVYDLAHRDGTVFEITVEDPCDAFKALRDAVEAARCKPLLAQHAEQPFPAGIVPRDVAERVRDHTLVTLKQVQRCYEILRLQFLQRARAQHDDATMHAFRLDVKRRLFHANVEGVKDRPRAELKDNLQLLYDDLVAGFRAALAGKDLQLED